MKTIWFKRKLYGWGWYPSTWQGWVVILIYVLMLIESFKRIDALSHSVSDTLLNFVPQTFIFTLILVIVCYKTGEKPKWSWGNKNIKIKK